MISAESRLVRADGLVDGAGNHIEGFVSFHFGSSGGDGEAYLRGANAPFIRGGTFGPVWATLSRSRADHRV